MDKKKKTDVSDSSETPDITADNRGRDEKGHFTKDHHGVFQPGNNANPTGRPKGIDIRKMFEDYLQAEDDGRTRLDKLIEGVFEHAMKGNSPYMNQLFDRTFGKVKQEFSVDGDLTVVREMNPQPFPPGWKPGDDDED